MAQLKRRYPGKSASEIYEKVDAVMAKVASEFSLDYQKDGKARTGEVHKMGVKGRYAVGEGEVTVELTFPMLVPGSMRRKVTDDIEKKLDGLFA